MIWSIFGKIVFAAYILFFLIFSFFNLKEKEWRAFARSTSFTFCLIILGAIFLLIIPEKQAWLFVGILVISIGFSFWLLFSPRPRSDIQQTGVPDKIDERDVIFARFDLKENSPHFQDYYSRKEEYKQIDKDIRKLPDILTSPHIQKDPVFFSLAAAEFDVLEQQLDQVTGPLSSEKWEYSPQENTRMIKNIIRYLGAQDCGICELDQAYVYSHVGRGPEPYGQEIKNSHRFAVLFTVEMDFNMIAAAPKPPVIAETAKQYVESAKISLIGASYIRRMGFPARPHIAGSNYQIMLTPLAYMAGLGELGRMGILITEKYGPRIRLGAITTDMPLITDNPKTFGVQDFCQNCKKCATNCPSKAIPMDDKTEENSVMKWVIQREECYRFWRKSGSDCSRCIYVCPYSKPDNFFHGFIRKVASSSSAGQLLSTHCDDLFYGHYPKPHKSWDVLAE